MQTIKPSTGQRGTLFVIIASTLWGTVGVVTQTLSNLTATTPLSISTLRLTVAAPVLLLVGWRMLGRRMWAVSRRDIGYMMLIGVLIAADQALYFVAISLTGVTISTLVAVCGAPVLVVILTALIERKIPGKFTLSMVALAFLGAVLLVVGKPTDARFASSLTGVAFATGSALGYAGIIVFSNFLSAKYHPVQITGIGFTTGAVCLLVVSHFVGFVGTYPAAGWLLILYVGVIPTALAYALFFVGMRTTQPPVASVLVLLEPLTASVVSWILFGERLALLGIVGAALLLIAIVALGRLPE